MILINTKTDDSFFNATYAEAGRRLHVDSKTIKRWKSKGTKKEQYNNWVIYFNPVQIKQKKGFALK
jgi:hypothetical protein